MDSKTTMGARLRNRIAITVALVAIGIPGILSLLLALPEIESNSRWALLINPSLLLVLSALTGSFAAPRCGFRSRIAGWVHNEPAALRPGHDGTILLAGGALGFVIALADHVVAPLWQNATASPPSLVENWSPAALLFGILYGGIVEEILTRWGLMSLIVLATWQLFARCAKRPPAGVVSTGILLAALLFAAGHLPALVATGADLHGPLLVRTLGFNTLVGLVFGWLYAHYDLESAMLAHAGFHFGIPLAVIAASMEV